MYNTNNFPLRALETLKNSLNKPAKHSNIMFLIF